MRSHISFIEVCEASNGIVFDCLLKRIGSVYPFVYAGKVTKAALDIDTASIVFKVVVRAWIRQENYFSFSVFFGSYIEQFTVFFPHCMVFSFNKYAGPFPDCPAVHYISTFALHTLSDIVKTFRRYCASNWLNRHYQNFCVRINFVTKQKDFW